MMSNELLRTTSKQTQLQFAVWLKAAWPWSLAQSTDVLLTRDYAMDGHGSMDTCMQLTFAH